MTLSLFMKISGLALVITGYFIAESKQPKDNTNIKNLLIGELLCISGFLVGVSSLFVEI